jgi:hypothetical protein
MLRSIVVGVVLLALTSAFSVTRSSNRPSTTITMAAEKSKSLPFLPQPQNIIGMAGDVGFDPFGFSDKLDVRWLREAELKHGVYLAMILVLLKYCVDFIALNCNKRW